MKHGVVLPFVDARTAADLAAAAEDAQWDGFFVPEPVWGIDAWVTLTAAAMRTSRLRLGTMLSPLSRMRPWKLASETVTLDQLSGGRVILSVGLGAIDTGFAEFGEVVDRKTRAALLDEGLDILVGLWRGQPFHYNGTHYRVTETNFYPPPPPVQTPRIPIWVAGAWPGAKSMRRVLKYDGLLPNPLSPEGKHIPLTPVTLAEMKQFVDANRTSTTPFDYVVEGNTPGENRAEAIAQVKPWADAGVTWWLESLWKLTDLEQMRLRIRQGPSRADQADS